MKYWIGFVTLLFLFTGCGNANKDSTGDQESQHSKTKKEKTAPKKTDGPNKHSASTADKPLKLNDGEKWPTDQSTRKGMQSIDSLVDAYSGMTKLSLKQYNQLGDGIHKRMQTILKQCSMEGPAHQELHKFISKMHPHIKALRGKKEKDAQKAFEKIGKLLDKYPQYFK